MTLNKDVWLGLATALVLCFIAGVGLGISIYLVRSGLLRQIDAPPVIWVVLAGASAVLIVNVLATVAKWLLQPANPTQARN
ncbi:MAG: hypothetical protein NUV78_00315 [Candidatus Zambryskibacteria bacterium]|nr:hypothetical protein [Candidatus Zambryskibacteria bacterium]